jgi:hypothetical protein
MYDVATALDPSRADGRRAAARTGFLDGYASRKTRALDPGELQFEKVTDFVGGLLMNGDIPDAITGGGGPAKPSTSKLALTGDPAVNAEKPAGLAPAFKLPTGRQPAARHPAAGQPDAGQPAAGTPPARLPASWPPLGAIPAAGGTAGVGAVTGVLRGIVAALQKLTGLLEQLIRRLVGKGGAGMLKGSGPMAGIGEGGKTGATVPVGDSGEASKAANPDGTVGPGRNRGALLAQLRADLGPDAGALDALEANGTLDRRGPDGRTVLDMLGEMRQMPLASLARRLGFTNASILRDTVRDLADPSQIRQRAGSDCVWGAVRFHMAKDAPADYVATALSLYRNGHVAIPGGGQVKLDRALEPFGISDNVGELYYRNGEMRVRTPFGVDKRADDLIEELLFDDNWINQQLARLPDLDTPFVRMMIADARERWKAGHKAEVLQAIVSMLDTYLGKHPELETAGVRYLIDHARDLNSPATQTAGALPAGLPLGKVKDYFPGLGAYLVGQNGSQAVDAAIGKGNEVPVVLSPEREGESLHLVRLLGRADGGGWLAFDPDTGLGRLSPAELRERCIAALLPPAVAGGLPEIAANDARPVGGGRNLGRAVAG